MGVYSDAERVTWLTKLRSVTKVYVYMTMLPLPAADCPRESDVTLFVLVHQLLLTD